VAEVRSVQINLRITPHMRRQITTLAKARELSKNRFAHARARCLRLAVLSSDQRIADGEERIARVSCLVTRLEAGGFDTSVARKFFGDDDREPRSHVRYRRSLACQR